MTRYILFWGDEDPVGGWNDFVGHADNIEALKLRFGNNQDALDLTWADIINIETLLRECSWSLTKGWENFK